MKPRTTLITGRSDAAPELRKLERRLMLKTGLSLGMLTMLTGCNLADGDVFDRALFAMSHFNDRVQALAVQQDTAGGDLPGEPHHQPVPLQRLLRRERRARHRWRHLEDVGVGARR